MNGMDFETETTQTEAVIKTKGGSGRLYLRGGGDCRRHVNRSAVGDDDRYGRDLRIGTRIEFCLSAVTRRKESESKMGAQKKTRPNDLCGRR